MTATASSGLAVGFSSDATAVCTVSGSLVSIVAGGTCTIRAKQAGNATYLAAVDVPQTFTVAPGSQTINFPVPASPTVGQVPRGLSATASSGLPVSFVSLTGSICSAALVGSVYQLSALVPGNCTIQASQAGNASYAAAPLVTRTFPVMDANVVTVIESPASNATVFGTFGVRGYALENSPGSTAVKIAGVALTITAQDGGTSPAVTGTATFGQVARQDICNPQTGSYPGGSDCPKVQFDYTWQTGLTTDWTALLPNGVYQVTATATNTASSPSSGSASVLVNVDNQPPSPVIVSPINSSGAYNTNQTFTVNFVSPHNSGDIGSGQIVFAQSPTLECTVQFLGGGAVYLLPGSQACVLSNASVTAADAYTLAVKVTISFPPVMLGQLSVQAYGTDEQGHAGPMTEVTKFTVTGVPMPALMSAGSSSFLVQSYQWTQGVQPVVLVNGAVGPVTVSGTQVLYPQYCPGYLVGPQASMTGAQTATLVSYGYVQYNSCLFATYNLSAPGLAPVLNAVYYGAALNPYFNIGVQQVLLSVPQGGSVTVPVTFTPAMGYAGPVQLGVYAPSGIAPTWDVSGVTLDGTNAGSGNLTLAVDPGLARGTYAVMIPGGTYAGNSGYLFVTVTPNTVPDFVLSPITSVSVTAGQAVSFSARVNSVAGFNGAVTVSSPGVAGAVGLTFSPNTTGALTAAGAAVTGTVATFASTPSCGQPYIVPVTAVSGGIAHSGTVSVMVHGGPAPGFTVSAPDVSVTQGMSVTVPVTITSSACFSGAASFSGASVGGGGMVSPANGSVVVNGLGSVVAGFTFVAPMGMPAGTYSGTATVTINGISHAASFSVKVVPPTTPYYTFTPYNSAPLVPGGSVTRYFVVQPANGYSGVPVFSVNPAFLPPGITVAFSDGGKATYGTATATITAANTVVPNNGFAIPVDSTDGQLHVSFPVGVQIVAAPLSVTYSVSYSNISSSTKRGTVAVLTPKITGGLPPYTVTGSGLGAQSGNTFTSPNAGADVVGTLTVTDTSGTVAQVAATVPAAPVVPDAILSAMAMERIAALENFAGQIVAAGRSDAALRAAFLTTAGVSAADYVGLRNQAMAYKSAQAAVKAGAGLALKPLLAAHLLPETAPVSSSLAQTLRGYYAQSLGLASSSGAAFSGLAGAAAMKANLVGPGSGDDYGCGLPCGGVFLFVDPWVYIDPASGAVQSGAHAQMDYIGPGDPALALTAEADGSLSGPGGGVLGSGYGSDTCGPGCADFYVGGQATGMGTYSVAATGTGTAFDQNTGVDETKIKIAQARAGWDPSSCAPSVSSIAVDGAATNAFVAGASGSAVVSGTCLMGVTSVSAQLPGLTVTLVSVSPGLVTLSYQTGSGGSTAIAGSVLLSVGNTKVPVSAVVVPSLPYISAITPSNWPAGAATTVTISGAGFGLTPSSASVSAVGETTGPLPFVVTGWSDGVIVGTAMPPGSDPGELVDVTVTGGVYAQGFQGQGSGRQGSPAAGAKPRVTSCVGGPSVTIGGRPMQLVDAVVTSPPYHAVLTAIGIPSAANGNYHWSTDNPSMIQFDNANAATVTITVATSGKASITATYTTPCGVGVSSFSFVLTDDTTVVGFIDASSITLPQNASGAIVSALGTPSNCFLTVNSWIAAGLGATLLANPSVTSDVDRQYANAFLTRSSGNPSPPSTLLADQDQQNFAASPNLYRAYNRLRVSYEVGPSGIVPGSVTYLRKDVRVGVTLDPCSAIQAIPVGAEADISNDTRAASPSLVYQLTQARIGSLGQQVNAYLNHPEDIGADLYIKSTPFIWSAVEFDAGGRLQPFAPNGTLQRFPTYWVYRNGILWQTVPQGSVDSFVSLDWTSAFVKPF